MHASASGELRSTVLTKFHSAHELNRKKRAFSRWWWTRVGGEVCRLLEGGGACVGSRAALSRAQNLTTRRVRSSARADGPMGEAADRVESGRVAKRVFELTPKEGEFSGARRREAKDEDRSCALHCEGSRTQGSWMDSVAERCCKLQEVPGSVKVRTGGDSPRASRP